MKTDWKKVRLDEMGTVSRGRSKHRPRNDSSLFNGEYPFIQTADVKNANLYITEFSQTYNEKGLAQSKLWNKGTLCITIAANIADTAILGIDACFPDSIMGFIPNTEISDVKYVKYCFDILQKECQSISVGAAQDNLSWEKLSRIKFSCPPLETQQKIASILSAYDDLIENNRKQIKLLEEAAQRLYKEWFVDLRFPGYENVAIVDGVPDGWRKVKVCDVIKTLPKTKQIKTADTLSQGKIPVIDQSREFIVGYTNDIETLIKSETPIIVFGDHTRILKLIQFPFARGADGTQVFISKNDCIKEYQLYCALKQVDLSNYSYARHFKYLKEIELLVATKNIAEQFELNATEIFKSVQCLRNKIQLLQQARDKLLPRLMSGDMEV